MDLAILLPPGDTSDQTAAWEECVSAMEHDLGRPVDLVALRKVSTVFQLEIISQDRLIAEPDPQARQTFEMLCLSYYQKLQDERRGILEAIKQSKRILL